MSEVSVSVAFRHLEPTNALKRYVEDKIHRIGKYFARPLKAHVVLSLDAKQRQIVEVELQAHRFKAHGKEENRDLYAAIDLVIDKLERQVQKHKEKIKLESRRKTRP
ncbi:MAG TPA: ribosome-associated translation inhibitor RaiA [Candidatus Eisenbacteria bacterium]|nr:ribosome-associated translation inhibitor RaiA [Candidatus Eisenbacteria bacterium]